MASGKQTTPLAYLLIFSIDLLHLCFLGRICISALLAAGAFMRILIYSYAIILSRKLITGLHLKYPRPLSVCMNVMGIKIKVLEMLAKQINRITALNLSLQKINNFSEGAVRFTTIIFIPTRIMKKEREVLLAGI